MEDKEFQDAWEEIIKRIKRYQEEALVLNPNSEEYKALSARVGVLNSVL